MKDEGKSKKKSEETFPLRGVEWDPNWDNIKVRNIDIQKLAMFGDAHLNNQKVRSNNVNDKVTLNELFNVQMQNQQDLLDMGSYADGDVHERLPSDNVKLSSYHIQQLISEVGELLSADKRWKNFRNEKNDMENKYEEIADLFIVVMNIAMFSGMDAETFENEVVKKLQVFRQRLDEIK